MVRHTIQLEGGYVDHPSDPGGATNYGVSLRWARSIGLDLNGDGVTDAEDIKLLTPAKAEELYLKHFFYQPRMDWLPEEIQPAVFDMGVHSGPATSIRLLQRVLNEFLEVDQGRTFKFAKLWDDGRMGPKTQEAVQQVWGAVGSFLINALVDARLDYYETLLKNNPERTRPFIRGWRNRADSFRVEV